MRRIPWGICLIAASGLATAGEIDLEAVRAYRTAHAASILRDYAELLAIPNTPAYPGGLVENAMAIRDRLLLRGVHAELLALGEAPPAVFGRLPVAGADRTLGVYVHYDGQPVEASRWTHPPFEPTLYTGPLETGGRPLAFPVDADKVDPEWRIYARSAGDDKAPVSAILVGLDALRASGIPATSNLVFFFEGEEERGSTHLRDYLKTYRDRLEEVDLWLICDGPVHQNRRPQLVFGVRGYTGLDLTVYGATRYLHSGHYGNWAPNPALRLAQLLSSMKDDEGRVLVAGFNESAEPLSAAEREALAAVPDVDTSLRRELGLARTEAANAPLAQRLNLPSLNIRGMVSASVGPTARNIIPPTAHASIDIRLVKGNDPDTMLDLVEEHIRRQGFHIVRDEPDATTRLARAKIVRVTRRPGYPAVRTAMDLPLARHVIAAAERVAGQPVILLPTLGGSLPLYLFTEHLNQPIVIVPIANHDDNQHAPDENLRVANLWYGIDLFSAIFTMP